MDHLLPNEKEFVEKALVSLDEFVPLYKFYQKKIFNYCLHRLPTEVDAEDTTSQVFVNALNSFANKQYVSSDEYTFKAWLFRIAHNLIVDFYRGKSRYKIIEIDENIVEDEATCQEIEETLDLERSSNKILAILKRFDDSTQSIFVLRFREDMNFEEIAQVISLDLSTTKMKYYRALNLIKKIIEKEKFIN
ncbi:MAG TPA: RNA polymerase sigma factor [Candidatus Dojkabacteria bacterium]|nr:RNA polymerase sigma factor [Candidatus Dojkabacteria bacterium]HRO65015.1 RNA polymerase sigma factor [Candidatus Dojkabacteria bacterium]HRP36500.1 RNA polymerase sigma factor [Candidatus Dojkabacteria bacterium]HRP51098.1 RNA polymerase sigma factor [Candidatus Dojkabacteria bacterium]